MQEREPRQRDGTKQRECTPYGKRYFSCHNNDDELTDYNNSGGDNEDAASDNDENVESVQTIKTIFFGTRIKDKINPDLVNSYFKVKINDTTKFLHKQSAAWLLTDKNDRLSTDRLSRVMGSSKIK